MAGYYFNLPLITDLTRGQQAALDETKPIAVSGGPGTGKSVVSLWRHIRNYANPQAQINVNPPKKSLLLTYTRTLTQYLKECCLTKSSAAAANVKTSLKGEPSSDERWDEIIIDEAQDLPEKYYEDIKGIAPVSYGADDSQILYPDKCSTQADLRRIFPDNEEYVLDKNFRSTYNIMQFAKLLFPNAVITAAVMNSLCDNIGEKPSLIISGGKSDGRNNDRRDRAIIDIINAFHEDTHNIAILVPWAKDVQIFEMVLKNNGIDDFSVYYSDSDCSFSGVETIKNIHITTFKSAKGLEFDTVIIPDFHKIDSNLSQYHIEWQDFYVAVTRAKRNLYLISNYDMPQLTDVVIKTIL